MSIRLLPKWRVRGRARPASAPNSVPPVPERVVASSRWRLAGRIALVLLGAVLFVRVLVAGDFFGALRTLREVGWKLPLALLPYLVVIGLDTAGWHAILVQLGQQVGFLRLLRVRIATESLLLGLPGGSVLSETLKPVLLLRDGVDVSVTTASLAGKKAFQVSSQGLYFLLAAAVAWRPLGELSRHIGAGPVLGPLVVLVGLVLVVAGLALAGVLASFHIASRIFALLRAIPIPRVRTWLSTREAEFLSTDALSRRLLGALPAHAPVPVLWLLGSWMAESAETWTLLAVLGVRLDFTEVLAFEPAVSLLRSLAFFLPGGLGVQDAAYLSSLAHLSSGRGVSAATAAAFVLLKRFKEVFWIVAGFVSLAGLGNTRK